MTDRLFARIATAVAGLVLSFGALAADGAAGVEALLAELVPQHRERGTLQPGDSPYVPPVVEPSDLRFPASAVPLLLPP